MTIARSRRWMRIRFGLRCPPCDVTKWDENSGCPPVRQESNPGRKSHSDVFSTVSTFATPKGPPLAYAFSMRYVLGLASGVTKTECDLMDASRHVSTST